MRSGRRFINRRSKSAPRAVTRIIGIDWQMPMAHAFPDESWLRLRFRTQPGRFCFTLFRHPLDQLTAVDLRTLFHTAAEQLSPFLEIFQTFPLDTRHSSLGICYD